MSPDKASVIAQMAATIYAHDKSQSYTSAVDHALALYERATHLVRTSGPTSKEFRGGRFGENEDG